MANIDVPTEKESSSSNGRALGKSSIEWNGGPDKGWQQRLLPQRIYLLLAAHILILGICYVASYLLRFDFAVPERMRAVFWDTLPWLVGVKLVLFYALGGFHGWWRYVTFADLVSLVRVSVLATLLIFAVDVFALTDIHIPRTVLLLDCGGTILLIGGSRSICRLVREHIWPALNSSRDGRTLVIAGGQNAEGLARLIQSDRRLDYRIVGFLDENLGNRGTSLGGIPFLGTPDEAIDLALRHDVKHVLAIANGLPGEKLRSLAEEGRRMGIRLKMIPAIDQLVNGTDRLEIRDPNINDLLRRAPVQLDMEAIDGMLHGRRVMVTGAGGSIGSEMCRQIAKCKPASLILVERAENNLFHIERELKRTDAADVVVPCVADVANRRRMQILFREHRPQIIFHAAAHKHVPLMESHPGEAIHNNVIGTKTLADLAREFGAQRMVLISTDKAVNPSSIMGVTKQLAERYVHACAEKASTRFVVVRFGNVLGSAGSVVPVFQEQIRRGGPITITHPEMRRFFMTIPEASRLVLQAATMGNGGEIFVLDMGSPVKILDLARDLIRLSGFLPGEIPIEIIGPRPGEKLDEELYLDEERTFPTTHPKIHAAYHRPFSLAEVQTSIAELEELIYEPADVICSKLREILPEYQPGSISPSTAGAFDPVEQVAS